MELSLALQESQRLITAWQTPLLFLLVQFLVVIIFFKKSSSASSSAEGEAHEQGQQDTDFWSAIDNMPSQLSRLPSFSATLNSAAPVASAFLPAAVVAGLHSWARRSASHVTRLPHQQQTAAASPGEAQALSPIVG